MLLPLPVSSLIDIELTLNNELYQRELVHFWHPATRWQFSMSALRPEPDLALFGSYFAFVPIGDIAQLLDHFVGPRAGKHRLLACA